MTRTARGTAGPSGSTAPRRQRGRSSARTRRSHLHLVDARDLVARVEEAVGELAVIGEQEQALGVEVEATDRGDAAGAADGSRSSTTGRPSGSWRRRHVAARLVQEHVACAAAAAADGRRP